MSIWDKYPDYSGDELRILAAVTAQVLMECDEAKDAVPADLLDMPARATAQQLAPLLDDADAAAVRAMLEDDDLARQAVLNVLQHVRDNPVLAARVDEAYEAQRRKMAVVGILLAGALVILAIKLKNVSFTKEGLKASFFESQQAVKTFVGGLTQLAKG